MRTILSRRPARLRAAAATLAVGTAAGMFSSVGAAAAATSLSAGFESGAANGWTYSDNVAVGSAYAHDGGFGARATSRAGAPGFLSWSSPQVTQGLRYGRIGGWVKISSFTAGQPVGVMNVRNANGFNHFDLWREPSTGKWRWDLLDSTWARSTTNAQVGQWYFIEAVVDFGGGSGSTYTARVRINGVDQPSITSRGQVGTTVRSGWFGGHNGDNAQTNVRLYDGLALRVSSTPLGFTR